MTDRLNDAPGDGSEPTGDEAPDLTDAQLAAATDAAEATVEEDEAGGESVLDAEVAEAEAEMAEAEAAEDEAAEGDAESEGMPAAPVRVGARQRAAEAAAARTAAAGRGPKAPKPTRTAFPIDPSLRIKDPASAVFVAGSILVFVLIFLNAMALGYGGAFTPVPTSAPIVSPSPAPSVSPGPSGSAAPSGSPAPSVAPSPSTPATTASPSLS
jgi:hypothetical protein